ncbi:dTDP-4-dehydrorhamnose 3,5-epimerase [Synergistales bacterium]|nr:dTDP-4-dehydrorhamnose 3,5-epimerase [Synergistales bacterium]
MEIMETKLAGVLLLEPRYFEDFRGYYCETYSRRAMRDELGIDTEFVQDGHSFSLKAGTLRGIHFQNNPKPQIKLVRCVRGKILDFVIDLQRDSKTFKQWLCVELSEENRNQIWIPSGFGHAFLTLTDNCEVLYKFSELYFPEHSRAIKWSDPEIGIEWGIATHPIISARDESAPLLKDSDVNFTADLNS